jgi:hypothetical protein
MRPRFSQWIAPALAASGLLTALAGCAGGTLGRVTNSDELPTDLSADMKQKFEVMDGAPQPAASPAPSLAGFDQPADHAAKSSKRKRRLPKTKKSDLDKAMAQAGGAKASPSPTPYVYPNRRPAKDPIWTGEKMVFDITYFGMSAGDFTLETLPVKTIDNRKVYHIKGSAVSSKVFNLFYRLNDTVETFIDYEGIFSHRFHIVLDETKQARDSLELYDPEKAQTFYWNRWNHRERGYTETKEFQPIPALSQDSLSALYYLRTVPLPDGAVVTVPVVSEGKNWEAVVTVMRHEMMRTPMGKVMTVVLKPETRFQGVLKKQGDSFLWLTDDDRRVIVRLEAKVKIGTVVANLKHFEPGTPPETPTPAPASTTPAALYQ